MGGELDLEAIEEWHGHAMTFHEALTPADTLRADVHDDVTRALEDIPALVAEVRRLREERDAAREEGRREHHAYVVAWLRHGIKRHPQPGVLADLACLLESNGAPVGPDDAP